MTSGTPAKASSLSSASPRRAGSAGCPAACTRPSRRTTAGAMATGLQNTTRSPPRIFPAPAAVSAEPPPVSGPRAAGPAGPQPPATDRARQREHALLHGIGTTPDALMARLFCAVHHEPPLTAAAHS